MELSFLNAIELLAGFQAFLFALYLAFKKESKKTSNYFIAFYILLLAFNVLNFFSELIFDHWSEKIAIFLQLSIFLAAPSLFLHIKTSLFSNYKLNTKDFWHIIPFLLALIISFSFGITDNQNGDVSNQADRAINIFLYILLYVQTFVYLFYSNRQVIKHKRIFFENYSNSNIQRYSYISNLILLVSIFFFLSMANIFTRWVFRFESFSFIPYVVIITILFFFSWLIIIGLRSPELFIDEDEAQPSVMNLVKNSAISPSQKLDKENAELVDRVNNYMKENEPFLDSSLTLHSLAQKTGIPSRELSILINHHLNKHFFSYVNEYRIEKAMELLANPDKSDFTVLEILYEVGFNSKSSFNTAFKKHIGLTPTEYRRKSSLSVA